MAVSSSQDDSSSAPKVTMITMDSLASVKRERTEPASAPAGPPGAADSTEIGAAGPGPSTATYTSLRRSTRSYRSSLVDAEPNVKAEPPASPIRSLDLSSYAYTPPVSTPPRKRVKREQDPLATPGTEGESKPATTPSSAKKSKPFPQLALDKPHPEPARWREQYRLIERMRRGIVAPVDDMGCERPQTVADSDPRTRRFHILISLMLSSQTKDAITSQAVTNLHTTLPGGLTAASLAVANPETVQECIAKVGFWRRKTEYIQEAARTLLERPGELKGDVPDTLEGLCELRGVGPKMAFLALQCAWDINAGIGVDVHVHRITNRLKWHKPPTTDPEKTRLNLQSWLPPELHKPINPMLVGFGQVICLPIGPRCDLCLLGQKRICPSRVSGVKADGRKEVVYTFTAEEDGEETVVGEVVKLEKMEDVDEVKAEDGAGLGVPVTAVEGPLVRVEVGYDEGPLVKLEPGVAVEGIVQPS